MKSLVMIAATAVIAASGFCADKGAGTPEELGKVVALCLLSNDLATLINKYALPDASFQRELTNSWRSIREDVERLRIPWTRVTFNKVEMKKLAAHGATRVADIIMVFTAGDNEFRIMLDESCEVDGRWFALDFDWLGIAPADRTIKRPTAP